MLAFFDILTIEYMKQQIVVIHGGDVFSSQKEYIQSLQRATLDLDRIRGVGWKNNLQSRLGKKFDVILPRMPNQNNAKYREWKIIFSKLIPLLDDNVMFIGHSLGGIFLAKYFSEEKVDLKVKAVFLVAAPYSVPGPNALDDFSIHKPLDKFQDQVKYIKLYHSSDDLVVPVSHLKKYVKELPDAEAKVFLDKGHFNQEDFAEIVKELKNLK